jgi:hypothetical protein
MIENQHTQKYLYHYTSQSGLLGIIANKKLWASHIFFQNDGSEFTYGKEQFYQYISSYFPQIFDNCNDIIPQIEEWISFFDNPLFTTSFSESRISLNQFRSYCKTKSGFSIGFDVNKIREKLLYSNYQCQLVKCVYTIEEQQKIIEEIVKKTIADKKLKNETDDDYISYIAAKIIHFSPIFKHSTFIEENEWRLVFDYINPVRNNYCFRPSESFIIPYLEIPIDICEVIGEIIIGPTPQKDLAILSTKELLKNNGFENSEAFKNITYCELPYRNW